MCRAIVVVLMLALLVAAAPPPLAHADSGQYIASSGESCDWYGSYGSYQLNCAGFNHGEYVNYTCNVTRFGSMTSWQCRDILNGGTWSGSR